MTDRIEVVDGGSRLSFSFEDILRYHGGGSPGGPSLARPERGRALERPADEVYAVVG